MFFAVATGQDDCRRSLVHTDSHQLQQSDNQADVRPTHHARHPSAQEQGRSGRLLSLALRTVGRVLNKNMPQGT